MTTSTAPTAPVITVEGKSLPLQAFQVQGKDHFWFCLPTPKGKPAMYGVAKPALGDSLPETIAIDGHTVHLAASLTDDNRPKVGYNGAVTLADGSSKMLRFTISVTNDGAWNLTAKVMGKPSAPARQLTSW